ncbi:IS30 family transposase, partial [Lapidilactobacillus concavus]|uniref:IS30 family transposase n=1 Tax=Lapidilactobacillus concavus TaxID=287844 RepID=UPI000ADF640C
FVYSGLGHRVLHLNCKLGENTNGLIREYFPKRTDIDNYTEQDVEHCQKQLNQRPRKVLNYETPYEVFFDKPLHLV